MSNETDKMKSQLRLLWLDDNLMHITRHAMHIANEILLVIKFTKNKSNKVRSVTICTRYVFRSQIGYLHFSQFSANYFVDRPIVCFFSRSRFSTLARNFVELNVLYFKKAEFGRHKSKIYQIWNQGSKVVFY